MARPARWLTTRLPRAGTRTAASNWWRSSKAANRLHQNGDASPRFLSPGRRARPACADRFSGFVSGGQAEALYLAGKPKGSTCCNQPARMTTAPSKLEILILAAGKGTRMRSELPKVLHRLAGKSLLGHVVDTTHALGAVQTCVVYGFGGDAVPQSMADARLTFVLQAEQHGTGHAVKQALPRLADDSVTLVLYGDVPLTHVRTLQPLVTAAGAGKLGLLTINLAQPDGYGRIVRDADGRVRSLVEHKDASPAGRAIHEVSTGILAVATRHLRRWIEELKNDNAQGEYYLTDIIALAVKDGVEVDTYQPGFEWEVLGVNSKAQLAQLERIHQGEIAQALLEAGVTLMDPARLDVRGTLSCGRDVVIDVNCVFEGNV